MAPSSLSTLSTPAVSNSRPQVFLYLKVLRPRLWRWRAVPAPKPRMGADSDLVACVAAVVFSRPWARHPAPEGAQLPLGDTRCSVVQNISASCSPQERAVAPFETKTRASRTVSQTRPKARLALRRSALWRRSRQKRGCRGSVANKNQGAPASAGGYRVYVSIATQLRATRRWFFLGRERVVPPRKGPATAGGHALWRQL